MKHSVLAFLILFIFGCKKSSLSDTPINNHSTSNSDTAFIATGTGGWSFQINGGEAVYGNTNGCQMYQSAPDSPYELNMSGIENGTEGIYSLFIQIDMPSNVPVVGQYTALPAGNYNSIQLWYLYAPSSYTIYSSDSIIFNVTSYDQTMGTVSATFSGKVTDAFGNMSTITNGSITGIIQQ